MKKWLIPETGRFYKANLHCHTVCSDGKLTPQEVKEYYTARGYSIIAYTDHNVLIPHPELRDENFLPLNGFEIDICQFEGEARKKGHTCHLCMIALEEDNVVTPFYHRTKYLYHGAALQRGNLIIDETAPDYERVYDGEHVTEVIQGCRKKGFFVTYNHPTWSHERYPDYMSYHGMHAMEIANFGSMVSGHDEYNPRVYDDFLCDGRKIYAIAADDNHKTIDACGAFTMIKADNLEYRTVTTALEQGHFYASMGPQIHALWFEDGKIHVTCSDVREICCHKQMVRRDRACRPAPGETLTEAAFDVFPDDGYVRLTLTDEKGNRADTNAYFVADLLAE